MTELQLQLIFRRINWGQGQDEHLRGQIIRRPGDGNNNETKIIKRYTFDDLASYYEKLPGIKALCETNNARFYLNPNVKSYKAIAFDLLERVAQNLKAENYKAMRALYDSVADSNTGIRDKQMWILDIDTKDLDILNKVKAEVDTTDSILIETKNGYHLLIKPQQIKADLEHLYQVETKKNALTLIYWAGKDKAEDEDKPKELKKKILLG